MFVDTTPESELKNCIQKAADKNKIPIKVIEKASNLIKRNIQKSNPFSKSHCGRRDCMMCKIKCKTNDRIRGIVYQLECRDCRKVLYRGQTSRSGNERINKHFHDWEAHKAGKRAKKSLLWEDSCNHHNNDNFNANVTVLTKFRWPYKAITNGIHNDRRTDWWRSND